MTVYDPALAARNRQMPVPRVVRAIEWLANLLGYTLLANQRRSWERKQYHQKCADELSKQISNAINARHEVGIQTGKMPPLNMEYELREMVRHSETAAWGHIGEKGLAYVRSMRGRKHS